MGPLASQILGIPLTLGFQLGFARRPIHRMWAFDAARFKVKRETVVLAALLVVTAGLCVALASRRVIPAGLARLGIVGFLAATALPAAFSIQEQKKSDLLKALPYAILGCAWALGLGRVLVEVLFHVPFAMHTPRWGDFGAMWMCEWIGLYAVDEVVLRGALDPFVRDASASRWNAVISGVFVSFLWAIWHLPTYPQGATTFWGLFQTMVRPFIFTTIIGGIIQTVMARRSRTLAASAAVHALGNAVTLSTF